MGARNRAAAMAINKWVVQNRRESAERSARYHKHRCGFLQIGICELSELKLLQGSGDDHNPRS